MAYAAWSNWAVAAAVLAAKEVWEWVSSERAYWAANAPHTAGWRPGVPGPDPLPGAAAGPLGFQVPDPWPPGPVDTWTRGYLRGMLSGGMVVLD